MMIEKKYIAFVVVFVIAAVVSVKGMIRANAEDRQSFIAVYGFAPELLKSDSIEADYQFTAKYTKICGPGRHTEMNQIGQFMPKHTDSDVCRNATRLALNFDYLTPGEPPTKKPGYAGGGGDRGQVRPSIKN